MQLILIWRIHGSLHAALMTQMADICVASLQCRTSGATSSRQAEGLQRKALSGREAQLGASHPDTLVFVGVLALILESQGKLEQARPRSGAER